MFCLQESKPFNNHWRAADYKNFQHLFASSVGFMDMFKREVTKFSLICSDKMKYRKLTIASCYPLDSLVPSCSLPEYHFVFLVDQLTAHDQVPSVNVAMSEKLWVT